MARSGHVTSGGSRLPRRARPPPPATCQAMPPLPGSLTPSTGRCPGPPRPAAPRRAERRQGGAPRPSLQPAPCPLPQTGTVHWDQTPAARPAAHPGPQLRASDEHRRGSSPASVRRLRKGERGPPAPLTVSPPARWQLPCPPHSRPGLAEARTPGGHPRPRPGHQRAPRASPLLCVWPSGDPSKSQSPEGHAQQASGSPARGFEPWMLAPQAVPPLGSKSPVWPVGPARCVWPTGAWLCTWVVGTGHSGQRGPLRAGAAARRAHGPASMSLSHEAPVAPGQEQPEASVHQAQRPPPCHYCHRPGRRHGHPP